MTRPWTIVFIASVGSGCASVSSAEVFDLAASERRHLLVTRNGSLPSGAPCTVALSVWGRRNQRARYISRAPSLRAARRASMLRRARKRSRSGPRRQAVCRGDCNTRMLLAGPPFSMVNSPTRPLGVIRSTTRGGIGGASAPRAKSLSSPPQNRHLFDDQNGLCLPWTRRRF